MKRVLLFVLTNFAILIVASVTLRLLGVGPWLNAQGISFSSLLIFGAVLGFLATMVVLWFSRQREFRADSGRKAEGLRSLFMSHPPIEERFAALQAAQIA